MKEGVVRRDKTRARIIRRSVAAVSAADAIGEISHGCEIFGVNKGKFSLIDIITHCLATTGPADLTVATWTAAGADMKFAHALLRDGRIRGIRFIVDWSFLTRQPEYCAAMRERFGDAAIRATKMHAKFVTIRNEEWSIAIRSSMNLNENRRLETFEISDDPRLTDYLDELVAELFADDPAGACFARDSVGQMATFDSVFEPAGAPVVATGLHESTDTRKYFGDGRYSNDLRRAGLVRQ